MKRFFTAVCAVLALAAALPFMLTAEATNKDNFWNEAAQGGLAEVALSNLALQRSQNEPVRQFAQEMVTAHTAANNELMSLATGKNVTLPTSMDAKHQSAMTKLSGKAAGDFDRDYMKTMVKDHEKIVKLFQDQSQNGTDANAKAWAAKTLPALQSRLQMARSVNASLQGGASGERNNRNSNSDRDTNVNSNRGSNSNSNSNRRGNSNSNSNNSNQRH